MSGPEFTPSVSDAETRGPFDNVGCPYGGAHYLPGSGEVPLSLGDPRGGLVVHKLVPGGGYLRSRCGSLSGMLRGGPHRGGAGNGVRTWVWRVGRRLPLMLAGGVLAVAALVACNSAEADPEPEPAAPTVPESTETDAAELDEASA